MNLTEITNENGNLINSNKKNIEDGRESIMKNNIRNGRLGKE